MIDENGGQIAVFDDRYSTGGEKYLWDSVQSSWILMENPEPIAQSLGIELRPDREYEVVKADANQQTEEGLVQVSHTYMIDTYNGVKLARQNEDGSWTRLTMETDMEEMLGHLAPIDAEYIFTSRNAIGYTKGGDRLYGSEVSSVIIGPKYTGNWEYVRVMYKGQREIKDIWIEVLLRDDTGQLVRRWVPTFSPSFNDIKPIQGLELSGGGNNSTFGKSEELIKLLRPGETLKIGAYYSRPSGYMSDGCNPANGVCNYDYNKGVGIFLKILRISRNFWMS